jgi:hypothetical protein
MAQKVEYVGVRTKDGCSVFCERQGESGTAESFPLPVRHDLRLHSEGFEWGYSGSGPAQTSLAILADAVGADKALPLYQKFKRAFIAGAEKDGFRISREAVEAWVAAHYRLPDDAVDGWADTLGASD